MAKRRKKFNLNRNNKKFLGVCAGIADYLGVESWIVRIIFLVSVFMGVWIMIPTYFICYFLMDNNSGEFKEQIGNNSVFKHFKNVDYKKPLCRNSRDAKFLGVCAGIADYFEIDVAIVRIVTFVSLFFAGPIPWVAYFAAYFVLEDSAKQPQLQYAMAPETNDDQQDSKPNETEKEAGEKSFRERFREGEFSSRREFQYCARKFGTLNDRLIRMEAFVTSKQFELHQQFKDLA